MLTKGISVDDAPLIEFMDEVKRWIHNGRTGLHMSHHVFDHLLMSTEMLYGVITSFRDLGQVAQKINMPSKCVFFAANAFRSFLAVSAFLVRVFSLINCIRG